MIFAKLYKYDIKSVTKDMQSVTAFLHFKIIRKSDLPWTNPLPSLQWWGEISLCNKVLRTWFFKGNINV